MKRVATLLARLCSSIAAPINSLQQFKVITQEAGVRGTRAEMTVAITSPSGHRIKAHIIPMAHGGYAVNFTPTELGDYLLHIAFGGIPISPVPYRSRCLPVAAVSAASKVRAFGPGLSGGQAGHQADFIIDTRGAGQGGLGVAIEGPCEAAINCRDNGDGTCSVAYLPTEPGDYNINVTFNDDLISGSPFQALIRAPDADVSQIRISGNGIQHNGTSVRVCHCSCLYQVYGNALPTPPFFLLLGSISKQENGTDLDSSPFTHTAKTAMILPAWNLELEAPFVVFILLSSFPLFISFNNFTGIDSSFFCTSVLTRAGY